MLKDSKHIVFKLMVTAKTVVKTTNVKCSTIGYNRLLRANRRCCTMQYLFTSMPRSGRGENAAKWAWRECREVDYAPSVELVKRRNDRE